jgi:hypothetical protein
VTGILKAKHASDVIARVLLPSITGFASVGLPAHNTGSAVAPVIRFAQELRKPTASAHPTCFAGSRSPGTLGEMPATSQNRRRVLRRCNARVPSDVILRLARCSHFC